MVRKISTFGRLTVLVRIMIGSAFIRLVRAGVIKRKMSMLYFIDYCQNGGHPEQLRELAWPKSYQSLIWSFKAYDVADIKKLRCADGITSLTEYAQTYLN